MPVHDPKPAALETARSLARLATEKSAVEQLAERRRNALIQNRDQIDKEVAPSLDALGTGIPQMKSMLEAAKPGSKEAAALTDLAAHVQIELASLGPTLAHSGDSVQALSALSPRTSTPSVPRSRSVNEESTSKNGSRARWSIRPLAKPAIWILLLIFSSNMSRRLPIRPVHGPSSTRGSVPSGNPS